MRYKLETGNGRATLLDRRRVMAKGLDIQDAERIVLALNEMEGLVETLTSLAAHEIGDALLCTTRLVPRYPEPDDHVN